MLILVSVFILLTKTAFSVNFAPLPFPLCSVSDWPLLQTLAQLEVPYLGYPFLFMIILMGLTDLLVHL